MAEMTPRFLLPFILPGQAQKEAFHNEALAILDAALHPGVETANLDEPPETPESGRCWIVGGDPAGAWSGHAGSIALWTEAGWRFIEPSVGMIVWNRTLHHWQFWTGTAWTQGEWPAARVVVDGLQVVGPRLPEVASPSGGMTIDTEARAAIDAIIATFKSHGLTD
jgi:hypothetical protein